MAGRLAVLLLLVLSALSSSQAWNVSIDCGGSQSFTDINSIEWTGDASFMQKGESHMVQQQTYRPLRSLRVFPPSPTIKRSCYSFNESTKGEQVLVRASFFYGNYDNRSLPPAFELQFDGNYWTTVQTEMDQAVSHEAIYFVKGDGISVCLAQTTADQLPFISTLEVRSLATDMYARSNHDLALFLQRRLAIGSTSKIRYPYDKYDRIWSPPLFPFANVITRKEQDLDINVGDDPPEVALLGAFSPLDTKDSIIVLFRGLPADEVPVHLNAYFAEVDKAAVESPLRNRTFVLRKNSAVLSSEPITPRYENATELSFSNITASNETFFIFAPTDDSAFAPIVNALEIFLVSDPLTEGTSSNDVRGLSALQAEFAAIKDWNGDPCLPAEYQWDWLNCSTDDVSKRVVALNLSGMGLSGPLPGFSSMDALQYIDLSNNSLNGSIPEFLGTLPNLKELNLANNNFSGLIPASLSSNASVSLIVTGNPNICHSKESCKEFSGSTYRKQRSSLHATFAVSATAFVVSLVL